MNRWFLSLFAVLFFAGMALGQSGRSKGSTGATGIWPVPPAPVASPSPSPSAENKAAKPAAPKIVDGERIYTSKEVDQKVQVLRKPSPSFSRDARRKMTRGYVVLRAILAADETVKHIEIITGLPDGLSEKAIEAARQIKFKPALKDGKPVSTWIEVEYGFYVY
jgi:outer membrane biosynthesis protein TonB